MKRVILLFALMLASVSAFADIHEFKYFAVDIPEGWSVDENGSVINIKADDNSGSLMIIADSLGGESLDELAVDFAGELGASAVTVDSQDNYTFEFADENKQATLTGGVDEDFYMLIAGSGLEQSGDALLKILDSLEIK
ncbi:MAG: hypothetical protein IJQ56_10720 [Synergistaceae bacterium]|nr:hypothetical protein [Synergistaceae bacterium]